MTLIAQTDRPELRGRKEMDEKEKKEEEKEKEKEAV